MIQIVIASAPATLMICGEHSVVYGKSAIVCAVNSRLSVQIIPRQDRKVIVVSALAEHRTDIDQLTDHPKLRFLLQALREERPSCGVNIWVESNIDPTMGLGSSAAVIVASLAALAKLNQKAFSSHTLHAKAMRVLLAVQQRGSGADLAAAIKGGMVLYHNGREKEISPLPIPPDLLSLRYAGYKTPTAEVLALVAQNSRADPKKYQTYYEKMGICTIKAATAAKEEQWPLFYAYLKEYQNYLEAIGVCDATQKAHLAACDSALSAKISGSGLGDCIIAFSQHLPVNHAPAVIDPQGVL